MRSPIRLETLRQEAHDELSNDGKSRYRSDDDPWEILTNSPTAAEQVVLSLRSETIALHNLHGERSRAYHPAAGRSGAKSFEYQLLRRIALDHPTLTHTVWGMLGRLNEAA